MEEIKISVIIPFYNARDFVTQAVESALQQHPVGEVLLIEDGSPDGGLEVCELLAQRYPQIKLLRHPNGENRGASASRNLGIQRASFPYVAFLDADDFYLPNRFTRTIEVITSGSDVDGVYEAIGAVFDDDSSRELFHTVGLRDITTVKREILPEDLFEAFMKGKAGGYYHLNGFTARKGIFSEVTYFDESLEMYEDTMLMFKLSAKCRLFPGNIETPVAMRRVHSTNRITYRFADKQKTYESVLELWELFLEWAKYNLPKEQVRWVYERVVVYIRNASFLKYSLLENFISSRKNMFRFAIKNPRVLQEFYFWRYLIPPIMGNLKKIMEWLHE